MENAPFIVKERQGADPWEKRFILVDPTSGEIIDDAQGYGYKTRQNAIKAGWYKFKGGKEKKASIEKQASAFWKNNQAFAKAVSDYFEINFKEIALGEDDPSKDVAQLATKMNIAGFETKFLEYLS